MKIKQALASLLFIITPVFVACGANQAGSFHTPYSPRQIAEIIIAEQTDIPLMQTLTPEDDFFWEFISNRYRITDIEITDGSIFFAGGVLAAEITVLQLADASDAPYVRDLLFEYISRRRSVFGGYAPTQAALLGNSIVSVHGNHVALLVTEDARNAALTFLACFSDNPPSLPEDSDLAALLVPPNEAEPPDTNESAPEGIYDPVSILHAWNTSDPSALTEMNGRIFEKCVYIIELLITDDMDDFEKQMAIHDWIIDWAEFDPEFLSDAPDARPDPNNDNPYGLLFSQVANCFGFTYTFQLFMDMLGIPCITVDGTDFTGGRHSWNLVRLDGVWYAVDITWNNPVDVPRTNRPRSVTHRFFNVTSETLFFYGHRWDRDSAPEATGSRGDTR